MPVKEKDKISSEFDAIALSVASPENILSWSHGEVTKPETINYRTQKPEMSGLFCERIFGPTKNWECYCGKYKKLRHKNIVCDKCGVEVTRNSVRRVRMGHIKLAVPVTHIWFLRSSPSRIGLLLDMPIKEIERVVYFANYIVKDIDEDARKSAISQLDAEYKVLRKKMMEDHATLKEELEKERDSLKAKEYEKKSENLEETIGQEIDELIDKHTEVKNELKELRKYQIFSELRYREFSMKFGHVFQAGIGAEAIQEVVENINLSHLIEELKLEFKESTGQRRNKLVRRIMLAGGLLKSGINPSWMVMTILPVIPPDLRPMVQLDGGRFATSDLNDLYRRVINRNNRLKRLLEIGAPEVICRNEKRMLQEAVDALIHNSARQGRAITKTGSSSLQLKSLSDILKGKQGRFRQNLLGKRVDYSGRSVIVVGPNLRLDECGIPKKMALELFKPFVYGKLIKAEIAHNIKNAEKLVGWNRPEIWDALEEATKDHYIILNRAPTLHRLGIQAFRPVLVEGKALQLHPLVCTAFNADFDGDQMAVHVPLSKMAQWEAKNIMASNKNLLKPSSGLPIINPTLDMVLGCYYLTSIDKRYKDKKYVFANADEAILANQFGNVHFRELVKIRYKGEIHETTVGRIIFNKILPEDYVFINEDMKSKTLSDLMSDLFNNYSVEVTAEIGDTIKDLGFEYATYSGVSLSSSDLVIPEKKKERVEDAEKNVEIINKQYRKGLITDHERYQHVIKLWTETKNKVTEDMVGCIDQNGSIAQMINSGARGNIGQLTQMAGMKGLVINPAGKIIELPIKANFKEGAEMLEYFISQHGGRKGRSDTALKTASAGYLTRRLVDAVQDVVVRIDDCGISGGVLVVAKSGDDIGGSIYTRIYGRVVAEDLKDKDGNILVKKNEVIDHTNIGAIEESDIKEVYCRSVLTCNTIGGVCAKCYGRDLSKNEVVNKGTAIGIIAAQSIGEPGTQLTMRTFHMGGVAEGKDITQGLPRVEELFEARAPKNEAPIAQFDGKVKIHRDGAKVIVNIFADKPSEDLYLLVDELEAVVQVGDEIKDKQIIAQRKQGRGNIKAKAAGVVTSIYGQKMKIKQNEPNVQENIFSYKESLLVKDNETILAGKPLIDGHLNLRGLIDVLGVKETQTYITKEVREIYASQGQSINEKHIEVIVRQMFSKARVINPGKLDYLPGQVIDYLEVEEILLDPKKEQESGLIVERLLLGLTRLSLSTSSWLSAASFQETIRVLVEAAVTRKIDHLFGLKENVIIGKLIPVGTNYDRDLRAEILNENNDEKPVATE